jgi:outer membrane protein OmpA-like peptidoglycan-associated protein
MPQRVKTVLRDKSVGRLLSVSLLALLLSGCSDLGLFTDTKTADDGTYPNLGSVPARPASRSDAPQRQAVRDGLASDRENARYSADPIRRPYPEGKAAALPPTLSDGNFPAPSTFRPTEAPIASAPITSAPMTAPITMEPISPPVGQVAPSSQGLPVPPPSQPRQPAPEAPPLAPVDLVPQAAPAPTSVTVSTPAAIPVAPITPAPQPPNGPSIDARLDAMLADAGIDPARRQSAADTAIPAPSLATLYFRDGSAHLDGAALTVLRNVAQIQQSRGERLVLVGHASRRAETNDPRKREMFNQKISAERAENVRKALLSLKVSALFLSVRAAGDTAAAYDEAAPAGEAANRKVEIYLED